VKAAGVRDPRPIRHTVNPEPHSKLRSKLLESSPEPRDPASNLLRRRILRWLLLLLLLLLQLLLLQLA
jgi:hypothetical protein